MFNFLRNSWRRWVKPQPKVWAVKDVYTGVWLKVVTYKTPKVWLTTIVPHSWMPVIGPFRSECDCEDFCDKFNKALVRRTVTLYKSTENSQGLA
jgi:hypothetical protein